MPRRRSGKRWQRITWWLMAFGTAIAVLSYTLGYPAGTTSFAYGVIWPMVTFMWSLLYKDALTRSGEW